MGHVNEGGVQIQNDCYLLATRALELGYNNEVPKRG